MNARERVLAAINHQPVDRVPTDIWATAEVWQKLKVHFGENADLPAILHIDGFGGVGADYIGPPAPVLPKGESADFWSMRYRETDYGAGVYSEQYFYPLAKVRTIADAERYAWPRADWFDYSGMKAAAKAAREKQAVAWGYMAIFFFHNKLRGLEQSLVDPLENPELTHHILNRMSDFFYEHQRRGFEACDGLIDVTQVTDDLGTQTGPMISLAIFREFYRPHMQRFINLAREFGIKVMHHDDGSMRMFLPDLVEMGIDILNPVQWTCPGMEREGLKRDFGARLCFHGAVENQKILPFGTPEEVRAEVRKDIDILTGDRTGYILAPCHNIQSITPVENIIAMYDEAWNYGKF